MLVATVTKTIPLTAVSFVLGLVIALVVALARLSSIGPLSTVARVYISLIRGTPLLVQLFIVFYALPQIGLVIDPFPAAVLAFSLNVGGYAAEVIRAAILSIPKGQQEGGTYIVPGHGRICDQADVVNYRDMVTMIGHRIADLIADGKTLEQVLAAQPTMDFDGRYGAPTPNWTKEMFIETVYNELKESKK